MSSSRREKGAIRDIVTDEQRRGRENWAAIFMRYLLDGALDCRIENLHLQAIAIH